jgi:beta-lactamase regulating signal transducer with metallopeptidase domain
MSIISILGESAVRSLALALAVALVLRVLRVQHAPLAKRAWTAVLILGLAMPALVALQIPSFSFLALWSTPRTVIVPAARSVSPQSSFALDTTDRFSAGSPSAFTATSVQSELFVPAATLKVPVPAPLQGAPAPVRHIAWWQIGFAAYLAITALLLLRVLLGLVLAARLWRRAQSFATSDTDLPVRLSVDLRSPATVGHGILLPLEAIEWDDAALRATLAHETKHIREGDFYLQLAATLHHCFFWISPHAWWLRPQLSRLSETICDRAAIALSGDGLSYAQLLVRFATAERTPEGMLAMAQSAGLRERIERLIADPQLSSAFRHRRGQTIAAAALFVVAAVIAAASVHIVQPATIVLAAPQAPAPPAAPTKPAPPSSAPAPAPNAAPAPAPPPAAPDLPPPPPDTFVGSCIPTIDQCTGEIGPGAHVIHVKPTIRFRANAVPMIDGQTIVIRDLDSVSPVLSVQPFAMMHPPFIMKDGMHVIAMPQVSVEGLDFDGPVSIGGPGVVICSPSEQNATEQCSLNGHKIKTGPGGAILFERDGKTWVIDDPALVKQAQQAYAHVNELGKQQGALGEKQGELGDQEGQLGELQGQIGALQGEMGDMHFDNMGNFKFEMPENFDKDIQVFTDGQTRLALERDKLSPQELAELEAKTKEARDRFNKDMEQFKAQQPQREAMEKQMRDQAEQIRKQMEPLVQKMHELAAKQGDLGRLQGELARQQALLGRQQREASREADSKVQSLIDQAVKDGKAHPAQ